MADADRRGSAPLPTEQPDAGGGEPFLSRWSRRKHEAASQPAGAPPEKAAPPDRKMPAPELPPLDKLTFDSDFHQFFHPEVADDVRRAALKKLFSDPRFNVMDGLDVYIDDYSKTEPIPAAMLAGLKQAQNIFGWAKGEDYDPAKTEPAQGASQQVSRPEPARLDAPGAKPEQSEVPASPASGPASVPPDGTGARGSS